MARQLRKYYQCRVVCQLAISIISGVGPIPRNSQGIPWCASYINSNGDLTVDLRTNLASELRAKLIYEHFIKFTEILTFMKILSFLMTCEVMHYKMFEASLDCIQPNSPRGALAADSRYLQNVYNLSDGTVRIPWNEGKIKVWVKILFMSKSL